MIYIKNMVNSKLTYSVWYRKHSNTLVYHNLCEFWVPGRGQISQPYFVIIEGFWSIPSLNHCTMKNMNSQNNTELKLLRVFFLDLGSRHFAFLYKNLSLPFTLLTIFETIISKFKYLSICTPKYLTTSVDVHVITCS